MLRRPVSRLCASKISRAPPCTQKRFVETQQNPFNILGGSALGTKELVKFRNDKLVLMSGKDNADISFPFNYSFLSPIRPQSYFGRLDLLFYKAIFDRSFDEHEFLTGAKEAFEAVRPVLTKRASQHFLTEQAHEDVSTEPMDTPQEMDQFLSQVCSDRLYTAIHEYYRDLAKDKYYLDGSHAEVKNIEISRVFTKKPVDAPALSAAFDTAIAVRIEAKEDIALKNEQHQIIYGSDEIRKKYSLWLFEKLHDESDWKLSYMFV